MQGPRAWLDALPRGGRVLVCVGLAALGGVVVVVGPREPEEDGRSLTEWVEEMAGQTPETIEWRRGQAAVQAMGASAVPGLVRHLTGREPAWRVPLGKWLERLGLEVPMSDRPWRRSMGAAYAFGALGARAAGAVPAITNLLQVNTRRLPAAVALAGIGEAGIPPLRDLAMATNAGIRIQVAMALRNAPEPGPLAVELLMRLLRDPQERVRSSAALSLALAKADPARVLPWLQTWLASGSPGDQEAAIAALSHYGTLARDALPALDRLATEAEAPLGGQARDAAELIRGTAPAVSAKSHE